MKKEEDFRLNAQFLIAFNANQTHLKHRFDFLQVLNTHKAY